MRTEGLRRAFVRVAPALVLVVFAAALLAVLGSAGDTLGYDAKAYIAAGHRLLNGEPLYDPSLVVAGPFGLYLYPPPVALAFVPLALLPETVAVGAWLAILAGAFLLGVALLPVRPGVRLAIVLLAALDWPFLYTMKLGQVTPILWLTFVIGWRALDRPTVLGGSIAIGALVKLQPALFGLWALVTGRWRAFVWALLVGAVIVLVTLPVTGIDSWKAFVDTLLRVSNAVTTPHNFAPGAIAFQSGVSQAAASALQWVWLALVAIVTVFAWLRRDAGTAYVVTVVASQAISPLLWDHYAMILLLPVALLLERRQWWAAVIPLAMWLPSPMIYPAGFALLEVATLFLQDGTHRDVSQLGLGRRGRMPTALSDVDP